MRSLFLIFNGKGNFMSEVNQKINWYPGHMAKTKKQLEKDLRLVDAVIELCDARAPYASRNPDLIHMTKGKRHILVLNKSDLADDSLTNKWIAFYKEKGLEVIAFHSTNGKPKKILDAVTNLVSDSVERMKARGAEKTVRIMVVGIPNVGKSTFINKLRGQAIAKAADKPGVTRTNQWIKIGPYLELLDTPGMLWPRLEDQDRARLLAYLGTINDSIINLEELAAELIRLLMVLKPEATLDRFKLKAYDPNLDAEHIMELAAAGRGWLLPGGKYDTERAAQLVLDEFRAGKIGKVTLEDGRR